MSAIKELSRTILLCRDHVAPELLDEEICERLQSVRILCASDIRNVSSHSGQTALVTLVSLLSRMGVQVELEVPEVPILAAQPPLQCGPLREALVASSERLVTGAKVRGNSRSDSDLIFLLGDSEIHDNGAPVWRLTGGDWWGALSRGDMSAAPAWAAVWPIGSMVSAVLAATEVFKFAMRCLPLRAQTDQEFFETTQFCKWDFGSIPLPNDEVDLGRVDFISAGAISQAALYALVRVPKARMRGRIFDNDLTDVSNLNRNMLTGLADVGSSKVGVVARWCSANLRLEPVTSRFPVEAGAIELANRILVGVDSIPSRWEVQRSAPGWLAVSGTSHFGVSSSAHSPNEPCCGCLHAVDDPGGSSPIPTVSFVSFWAGLAMAVRLIREALAHGYPRSRQHLWIAPLRMDQPHAAIWSPVAFRRDCPLACADSRSV